MTRLERPSVYKGASLPLSFHMEMIRSQPNRKFRLFASNRLSICSLRVGNVLPFKASVWFFLFFLSPGIGIFHRICQISSCCSFVYTLQSLPFPIPRFTFIPALFTRRVVIGVVPLLLFDFPRNCTVRWVLFRNFTVPAPAPPRVLPRPPNYHCGRVRWRVCGGVWAVAMEWRVSGGDPQVFCFLCFYSSLYSRVFSRS